MKRLIFLFAFVILVIQINIVSADPNDLVYFADDNLKAAVEEALDVNDPTENDMLSFSWYVFSASNRRITDLTGLEYAYNLRGLSLQNNFISDLSSLSQLTNLTALYLDDNQISDITALSQLTKLSRLYLSGNQISDLSPLSELTNLTHLNLSSNQISDIAPLSELTNLTSLTLRTNEISDISALSQLTNLTLLSIYENQILDISAISQLTKLNVLDISYNHIFDLSPLSQLTNLTDLRLDSNLIFHISPLSQLTNLTELRLNRNQIFDLSALSQLKKLTLLELWANQISDLSPLLELNNLNRLDLIANNISDISPLSQLKNLTQLALENNHILDLSPLSQLTNLSNLYLSDNKISDISVLSQLTNLTMLRLSYNLISDISALLHLTNLNWLALDGNPLNCTAYCVDIPLIKNNNSFLSNFDYDPKPDDCFCDPQEGTIFFVDASADGNNDGSSWDNAFKYLQDALKAVKYGDEIRVAQGVYKPDQGLDINPGDCEAIFQLKSGVTVKGGYPGLGIKDINGIEIDPNERDVGRFETILSGDLAGNDDENWAGDGDDPSRLDNSMHVVSVAYCDSDTVLDGFTITAGYALYISPIGSYIGLGGGVTDVGGDLYGQPKLINCKILNNYAESYGGGLRLSGSPTLINCEFVNNHTGGDGGGIEFGTNPVAYTTVQGCLFYGNSAGGAGGGVYGPYGYGIVYSDCIFIENSARYAGALSGPYDRSSEVAFNNVEIQKNFAAPGEPNAGYFQNTNINLMGDLNLGDGTFDVSSVLIEGVGRFNIAEQAALRIVGGPFSYPTVIRSIVNGPGNIEIAPGTQLILEGDSIVNLSGLENELPDPETRGRIIVGGSLVVQGNATLEGTNVDVMLLDVNTPNDIKYNNITLLEASTGFGGEFFVRENAKIKHNNIVSEGDRYLDLDPDPSIPENERPVIENNKITVIIKEGTTGSQGTLLELRARDYDCGWFGSPNPDCASGAYQVSADSIGFTDDPSENWVLEKLELKENAKLNLTNRQGFDFQDYSDPNYAGIETVYVKELVMGPNSVLNTALQTLYYQNLLDPNGQELLRDPNDPLAPLANGSRFEDIPLLGFSLGIIAMDDPTPSPNNEFDIRVRTRLLDPIDEQPDPNDPIRKGSIERLSDDPDIPAGSGGVMDMRTQEIGKLTASSVAAKGAFARAGDENITIKFEYMFMADPYDEAEIIVYLSDHPEVGENLVEVARIKPLPIDRPGSIGSGRFGVFSGIFQPGILNFTRGTYIELELRGRNTRCWIDNWDPQVNCSGICMDLNWSNAPDEEDFLLVISEYGTSAESLGRICLDGVFSTDGYIDSYDILSWDWALNNANERCNLCPPGTSKGDLPISMDSLVSFVNAWLGGIDEPSLATDFTNSLSDLLIVGKRDSSATKLKDRLYIFDSNSLYEGGLEPTSDQGNIRIIQDYNGNLYQINSETGIIKLDGSDEIVVPSDQTAIANEPRYNKYATIYVGIQNEDFSLFGRPVLDAVFDVDDANYLYIVPVVVSPEDEEAYLAAAKLQLFDTGEPPYQVVQLYDDSPAVNDNRYRDNLREIEIDNEGNIYVINAHSVNESDVLWKYSSNGILLDRLELGNPDSNSYLPDPIAMHVSNVNDMIYLASGQYVQDSYSTKICGFSKTDMTLKRTMTINNMQHITGITENPATGELWIAGFNLDDNIPAYPSPYETSFYYPVLAGIPLDSDNAEVTVLQGNYDLALPMSIVWTGDIK